MVDIIKTAYQKMCKSLPGSYKTMAAMLNISPSALDNRIYERKGQSVDVSLALAMQDNSESDEFAKAIAEVSGGVFVKLPQMADFDSEEIQPKFIELLEHMGELASEWRGSTEDGEVDKIERRRLEVLAQQIHQTVAEINALTFKYYCAAPKGGYDE